VTRSSSYPLPKQTTPATSMPSSSPTTTIVLGRGLSGPVQSLAETLSKSRKSRELASEIQRPITKSVALDTRRGSTT
jgi:hypothetical protein